MLQVKTKGRPDSQQTGSANSSRDPLGTEENGSFRLQDNGARRQHRRRAPFLVQGQLIWDGAILANPTNGLSFIPAPGDSLPAEG